MRKGIGFLQFLIFAGFSDGLMEWSMAGFVVIGAISLAVLAACVLPADAR